ncbi:MAG: class I tRNA ligase family protein, partial [Patescibacteria group bacterium]
GEATGLYCINQLNGYRMPLFVSDFVLMGFGTGAVVGVPGHDLRDFEFAIQFDIPVKRVVVGSDGDTSAITKEEQVQEEEGTMVNSEFLDGLDIHEATRRMMDLLEKKGWGKRVTTYHLRDWLISRQRYWGPPIPMVFCKKCASEGRSWFTTDEAQSMPNAELRMLNKANQKDDIQHSSFDIQHSAGWYPVPEDQLPVLLPRIEDYKPGDDGVAPLAKHKEFYETTCPGCGGPAVRETDVSDTFLDSSWYFLRYPSVRNAKCQMPNAKLIQHSTFNIQHSELPWDPQITRRWLPVHMYTGGAEHSVLHLLYSRFVTMALHDWGYLDFEEPFTRFYAHGLVIKDGAKMSKSKGNVVAPDEYIASYGADALRLYLMFMGPFDQGGDFRDTAMEGMHRWIGRVWRLAMSAVSPETQRALHRLVKKVTEDMEKRRYNTAIAAMMEFTNLVEGKGSGLGREELKTFILLLAPFAPYLAEELWQRVRGAEVGMPLSRAVKVQTATSPAGLMSQGRDGTSKRHASPRLASSGSRWSVHLQPWPSYDPSMLEEEAVDIIVQVNGKLRETISMPNAKCQMPNEVESEARKSEKVQKYLAGQKIKKVIFVPGRLINFVV